MDALNRKVFDKRIELIDNEISLCASRNKKISYEDLLEKLGISAEAVRILQPATVDKNRPEIIDFVPNQHGIENFDPKNRLISLRTIGSLKTSGLSSSNNVLAIEDVSMTDRTERTGRASPLNPKNLIKKLNEEKQ